MTGPQRATHHARGQFQSTPSVWRETSFSYCQALFVIFQSTPSVWRETVLIDVDDETQSISIHSLRVEGDDTLAALVMGKDISIHSLRVEGDDDRLERYKNSCDFNPLPPCGGRHRQHFVQIVIVYFNPLPPCGGRQK